MKGARELDHAPVVSTGRSRSSAKVIETYVTFKVEGTQKAKSHPSRTDRWLDEFEIPVEKANEVEIAIFDKQASETHPVPIGLLWIKIGDLVEAQRRQKVMIESGQGGWVTARAMDDDSPITAPAVYPSGNGGMDAPIGFGGDVKPMGAPPAAGTEGIDAWFSVEPAGALALHVNFGEQTEL